MPMKEIEPGRVLRTAESSEEDIKQLTDGAKAMLFDAIDNGKDFFVAVIESGEEEGTIGEITITGHGSPPTMFAVAECLIDKAENISVEQEAGGVDSFLKTLQEIFGEGNVHILTEGEGFEDPDTKPGDVVVSVDKKD